MPVSEERYEEKQFVLDVPLDGSLIGADADGQELRVVARHADGCLSSKTVRVQPGEHASVRFHFDESPGPLQLLVGPATATESDVVRHQTLSVDVRGRQWSDTSRVSLEPIALTPYYWWWWLDWCRPFVITGKVVCADGSPVPGATVCAYDIDWWFWWTSTQQIGPCATTQLDGTFEIDFTWCCGLWPWWWWLDRVWEIDSDLITRVGGVLEQDPRINLGRVDSKPSLAAFSELLGPTAANRGPLVPDDHAHLETVRSTLAAKLPGSAELSALGVWPWAPWRPWWDCNPDVIFKVTQDCTAPGTVLLDEGIGDVRVNIGTSTQVTLVANELACCVQTCPTHPCHEGQCIDVFDVCLIAINDIGGNPGSPPATPTALTGYASPGSGDRAFGGTVKVHNENIMTGVDYYEVQYFDGTAWSGLPPGAAENFYRTWLEPAPWPAVWPSGAVPFPFTNRVVAGSSPVATVMVVESREHYEASPGLPGAAVWTSPNASLVIPIDSSRFSDGTYKFRVVAWREAAGGEVAGPPVIPGANYTTLGGEVLPVCDLPDAKLQDNGWVLHFNNRLDPDPGAILPCGSGSTHACVTQPNTNIISVKIDGVPVSVCGTAAAATGTLEVEFLAEDVTGNLSSFSLKAVYGNSLSVDLLAPGPGRTLSVVSGLGYPGPTYAEAVTQGAPRPVWKGGRMLLTMPAHEAFPVPCCYDLELEASCRTIVSCNGDYGNRSDFTVGVGVCPPHPELGIIAEVAPLGA